MLWTLTALGLSQDGTGQNKISLFPSLAPVGVILELINLTFKTSQERLKALCGPASYHTAAKALGNSRKIP